MDANVVMTQFTSGAVAVWAIEHIKAFGWLKQEGQIWGKRILSILAAITIHTSISYVWNPSSHPGWHVLVINIPPATVVAVELYNWLGQYVVQESFYQVVYNKPKTP